MSVIDYLNDKACKQFKAFSKATARLVKARFSEEYLLTDCKKVTDTKANGWLANPYWQKYLRSSTSFNATNFENYLEESWVSHLPKSSPPKLLELDFSKGEALRKTCHEKIEKSVLGTMLTENYLVVDSDV